MPNRPGNGHKQPLYRYRKCFCASRGCNGTLVTKKTFISHQEADARVQAIRDEARERARFRNITPTIRNNEMQEPCQYNPENAVLQDDYDLDEFDYVEENPLFDLPGWNKPHDGNNGSGKTLAHIVYRFLDWSTGKKITSAAAKGAWDLTGIMREEEAAALPPYSRLESMLQKHREQTTVRVDCCVNMCIAYWNPTHPDLQTPDTMNAHRRVCPVCNEPRYITDPKTKKQIPRRIFFYLPLRYWLQDLFAKPDLVPEMANDLDPQSFPDGHIRRTEGWRDKVTLNANINADRRNKALSLAADGVPYFDEQGSASGWPIILMDETLPLPSSRQTAYAHMVALVPSSYKDIDNNDKDNPKIITRSRYIMTMYFIIYINILYLCIYIYLIINIRTCITLHCIAYTYYIITCIQCTLLYIYNNVYIYMSMNIYICIYTCIYIYIYIYFGDRTYIACMCNVCIIYTYNNMYTLYILNII